MQLVILLTNLPTLLFPREHHYTQPKYSKLGFLYREQGKKMTDFYRSLGRDARILLWRSEQSTLKTQQAQEAAGSSSWKNICSTCGYFSDLGSHLVPQLSLCRGQQEGFGGRVGAGPSHCGSFSSYRLRIPRGSLREQNLLNWSSKHLKN